MSLATNITNLATRVATESKALRTLLNGNAADNSALTTVAKSNLVAAINELKAAIGAGSPTTLDDLTDVAIVTPATGHLIRHNGTNWINVLDTTLYDAVGAAASAQSASQPLDADLTAIAAVASQTAYGRAFLALVNQAGLVALLPNYQPLDADLTTIAALVQTAYGQNFLTLANQAALVALLPTYQPLDADLTSIAALTTTAYGRGLLTLADAAAQTAALSAATALLPGIVELATTAETTAGIDTVRAVTPAGVAAAVAALVNAAPGTLDTLNELAVALGNDPSFATTMTNALATKQPLNTDLTAIAALVSAADKVPYSTGVGTWALQTFTAAGRTLAGAADAGAQRTALAVYSTTDIGDPTTDFVATFNAGLV